MNKKTSNKTGGYYISVLTGTKGNRKPLKENVSSYPNWEPIVFSTRRQAQKEIDSMTSDTIRVYQPKVEKIR